MKAKPLPSREYLLSRLSYDPETGRLAWLPKIVGGADRDAYRWNGRYAGTQPGRRDKRGYLHIMLDGQFYRAHRMIWRMMTGDDPGEAEVDHRDTVASNEKWENLRLADRSGNCGNVRCKRTSGTQIKGVHPVPSGRFVAKICVNRRPKHLGTFDTIEEAMNAYAVASAEGRGEFARLS